MSVNSIMTRLEGDYSSLKRTLSQVNRDIKVTSSEFGAAASAVSKTNATLDQLENKNKSAAKAVEIYNKKLEQLKTLQDAISKQKGVDSYEYKEITSEINRATKAMNGYKNEIEQTNAQIDKMSQKSAMTFDKVSSGLKAIRNTGAVMSATVTAPLVMFGKNAVQGYVDAQETEDLFRVSLGTNANDASSFVDEKVSQMKQIDPLVMKENIAVMYEMTHAMGATSSSSLDMSKNLAMLAEDLGSLKNVDTSVAFDKLRSAMSGESEPLKAWGYIINDTNVKQWALTNGLIQQGEELDDAQKAWARYNLILEKTKTAQGNLLETGDSPANQIKATKAELAQASREIGEKLLPLLSDLLGVVNGVIDKWNGLSDSTQENIIKMGLFVAAAGPVMTVLGQIGSTVVNVASKISKAAKEAGGLTNALKNIKIGGVGAVGIAVGTATILQGIINNELQDEINKKLQSNTDLHDSTLKKYADDLAGKMNPEQLKLDSENKKLEKSISAISASYDKKIKNASKAEQAAKKAIQNETEAYKKGYDERIKLIESEYNAKIKAIENEEKEKLASLQSRIDEIDSQTAAEEKAEKEKTDALTEQQLKQNVAMAKTAEKRKQAQNELDNFYAKKEKERISEEREALKASLKNQMEKVKEESNAKTSALKDELSQTKEAEQEKLNDFKSKQEERLSALDGFAEREIERLTNLKNSAISAEQEKTNSITSKIQERIDKYNEEYKKLVELENQRNKLTQDDLKYESDIAHKKSWMYALSPAMGLTDFISSKLTGGKVDPLKEIFPKKNYTGDNNWRGGLTRVHDKFGGEIINLPSGSQILPHDISMLIAETAGKNLSSTALSGNLSATLPINIYIGNDRLESKIAQIQLKGQTARKRGLGK